MSKKLQLRGGTTSQHNSFTGAIREVTVDTNKDTLVVHDGSTQGGFALPRTGAEISALVTIANDAVTEAKLNLISTSSVPSLEAKGTSGSTSGYIKLNCSENSHGIKLLGPPHSASANYTLTFPNNDGDANQVLTTNGSGVMTWAAIGSNSITDGDVTTAKLANDSVTGDKIAHNVALVGNPTTTTQAESDNTTKLATTAYVTSKITTLIGGAPSTLNDLNELAAAINDDANYNSTLTTALGTKAPLASPTFTGNIGMPAGSIDHGFLAADCVDGDNIGDGVINSEHYANASIDSAHIANNTITAGNIAANAIGTSEMAANSVDSDAYVDGSIDTAHYANGSVTGVKLHVDRRSTGTGTDIYSGNNHDYTFYDADVGIRWHTNNAEDMRLTDAGVLHVDGDIVAFSSTTPSDERLKHDIEPITDALSKVGQLNGCTFIYNNENKRSAGLIAQDVEKVLPSAVSEMELPLQHDDGIAYKTVQYDQTIGLLVEAIKELTAKVEQLENK